jgi:hypothetical protein
MTPYLKELYGDQLYDDRQITKKLSEFNKAVNEFQLLKEKFKEKKPATSELLEWIKVLEMNQFFTGDTDFKNLTAEQKNILRFTLPILAKTKDDLDILRKELQLETISTDKQNNGR